MNPFLKRNTNAPLLSRSRFTRCTMMTGAVLVAGSLMLTACGGGDDPSVAPPSANAQSKGVSSAPSTDGDANQQSSS
jgi:hypothetical protein